MKTLIGKVRKVAVNRTSKEHVNARSLVRLQRRFPATLVVGYGEMKQVRDSALRCPGIASAIRRGWLAVR